MLTAAEATLEQRPEEAEESCLGPRAGLKRRQTHAREQQSSQGEEETRLSQVK